MKRKVKCRRCVTGHSTRIWDAHGTYVVTYCAVCRRAMSALDAMRARFSLLPPAPRLVGPGEDVKVRQTGEAE